MHTDIMDTDSLPTHIILLQTGDAEADMAESKGKLKRFQRLVKVKKGSQMGLDDGKTDSNCEF